MMKLILFITALLALVCSDEVNIRCYWCKTPDLESSDPRFRSLPLCDKDIEKSQTVNVSGLRFDKCKKILEKVKKSDKEETLIIRTFEKGNEPLNLTKTIFTEYDCNTDLCNAGAYATPAWLTLFLSIPLLISINI